MDKLDKQRFPEWTILTIISITFLIVYIQTYDSKVAILGDNAAYYLLGNGIAEGHGYANYFTPAKSPHNHYPPGYPFLISLIALVVSNVQVIKILNGVLLFGTVLLTYFTSLRLRINQLVAMVISLVVILNTNLLYYGSIMMSEVPFSFFSILIFYLFLRIDFKHKPFKNPLLYIIILLLVYSFYIRAFGIALIGAVIIFLLFQKNIKCSLLVAIGFVIGILPWQIRSAALGGSSQLSVIFRKNYYAPESGTIDVGDMISRIFSNFSRIISAELPQTIFPSLIQTSEGTDWIMFFLGLVIIAVMIYGAIKLKDKGLFLGMYLIFTVLILLIWPDYFSSLRYFAPVVPFIAILFYFGVYKTLHDLLKKLHYSFNFHPAVLLLFLFFYFKPVSELKAKSNLPYPLTWAHYFAVAEWVQKNTPQNSVVSCRKPFLFYLESNRTVTHYKYTDDSSELIRDFEEKGVDFVVYDQLGFGTTPRYLGKAIQENPQRFQFILDLGPEDRKTYLFKFIVE